MVESHLDHAARLVRSFANIYETMPDAERAETFSAFARKTLATNPEIQALSSNPRIVASQRIDFEQRARLPGYQDFCVFEQTDAGAVSPQRAR